MRNVFLYAMIYDTVTVKSRGVGMKKKQYLFTTGEFAKMNGVNKRTLHYYHEIGLFSPEAVGENGYRYYTCFQSVQLELILMLRRLGLSIEQIQEYIRCPSAASFVQLAEEKKEIIDRAIRQLNEAKEFLQMKSDKLELGLAAEHGRIERVELPEARLLLSAPISGRYDEEDFAVASEFSLRLKKVFGLYDNFGSRILVEHLFSGQLQSYDCFFAYGRGEDTEYDAIRPAGSYLRAFCVGGWERLEEVYRQIVSFAEEHRLTLCGYAYEEGLNEMMLQRDEEYITMITVGYMKS